MVSKSLIDWDVKFAHAQFAHNRTPSYATSHSPFKVSYGLNPLIPIDLIPIPQQSRVSFEAEARDKEMKKLHEQVRAQTEKVNE